MTTAIHRFLAFLLVAGICVFGPIEFAAGQKPFAQVPAAERQLIAIKVTGSKRFGESDIAAATGLQIGTTVTEDDFKKASRHLGDLGTFSQIEYTYSYSSAGTKVEFHVTDQEKFVPAHFEDFVWFSDAELLRRIKEHVPMFDGELPASGRMADEISDVLQALLVQAAIPGHVEYLRKSKLDGPLESIDYSITDVAIQVGHIEFVGVGSDELLRLNDAATKFSGRAYSRTLLDAFVQRQVLPVFRERGFLKAACGEPQPRVVKQPSAKAAAGNPDAPAEGSKDQTIVDVTFSVTPGAQYKLKAVEWSGNHEFPSDTLQKMIHASLDQPANTVRLTDNLKEVQRLYGSRGYVTTAVKVNAEFDDAASTVVFHLEVNEGAVYHMGDLEFRGLDNSLTAKLRAVWKIRAGDIYDVTYLDSYLPEAQKLLPSRLDWEVAPHVTANVRDKSVDVDLIFSVRAPD